MALSHAKIKLEIREILLKDRPPSLYDISPKGTVPVLQLPNKDMSDAVEARTEVDLRIGASFTRFMSFLISFSKNELFSLRRNSSLIFSLCFSAFSPSKTIDSIRGFSSTTIVYVLFFNSTVMLEKKFDS